MLRRLETGPNLKTLQRECKKEFKKAEIGHINSTIIKRLEEKKQ